MAAFSILSRYRQGFVFVLTTLLGNLISAPIALAEKYTPEHPAVQEMVKKGMEYLTSSGGKLTGEGVNILAGYTICKVDGNPDQPIVVSAIAEARKLAADAGAGRPVSDTKSMYVPALSSMLLASVDVEAYGYEIRQLRDFLLSSQKPNGGFGYVMEGTYSNSGDMSQIQYVMLGLWTMSQLGIEVPQEPIGRCIQFLVNVQTPDGGWPYQSTGTPGDNGAATNSLSAAGFSALLIAGDILGLYRSKVAENQEEEGIIPIAFKRIMPESQKAKNTANFDRTRLDLAAKKAEQWHVTHPYRRATWHYYYVYGRERYESFLEITKGKQQKSPDWYNQAVEMLQQDQSLSGAWGASGKDGDGSLGPHVCTSFAILFLIRSTQKSIGSISEAIVVGGVDLPDDLDAVRVVGGKVMSKKATTSIDDALKMLEEEGKNDGKGELSADKIQLANDPARRKEQLNRFERLLNAKEPETRRIAAKLIGRGDDLDLVPSLIYALVTDPDPEVPRIAEQSLRQLSRQLDTHFLPKDASTKLSDSAKIKAGSQWKKWFLSLRPDFVFVD